MTDQPLLLLILTVAGLYLGKLWRDDLRAARAGRPHPRALPGATTAPRRILILAVAGAAVLLALETVGEIRLGLSAQQSHVTGLFSAYTLVAAVIEEIVFRGYIVITRHGTAWRWTGIIAASGLFALLHPFLWRWDAGLALTLTPKGLFSTALVFLDSIWFYWLRFARWNPQHSLLPCFAAHAGKNLGVIAIKAAQGFLTGWW